MLASISLDIGQELQAEHSFPHVRTESRVHFLEGCLEMIGLLNVANIFLGCQSPSCFPWSNFQLRLGTEITFPAVLAISSVICILSAVNKDVLYQGDFFVGSENILHRTMEQLAEACCVLKDAAMNAKRDIAQNRPIRSFF